MEDDYLEREQTAHQPPWYLLTGILLGLIAGLVISLLISPVRYKDASPAALTLEEKADFRLLIARAYRANPDTARALSRIALLKESNAMDNLAAQAQQALSAGEEQAARDLAGLAAAISSYSMELLTTALPTGAVNGSPAAVLAPTLTPPTAIFIEVDRQTVCDAAAGSLLQIELRDREGYPVPGIQINVSWDGGMDTFFTGLKPAISTGYADFEMMPGVSYNLQVGEGGETLKAISAPECIDAAGNTFAGGLKLVFGQ